CRPERGPESPAPQVDPRVGENEDRDDDERDRRAERQMKPLVHRDRPREAKLHAARRAGSGGLPVVTEEVLRTEHVVPLRLAGRPPRQARGPPTARRRRGRTDRFATRACGRAATVQPGRRPPPRAASPRPPRSRRRRSWRPSVCRQTPTTSETRRATVSTSVDRTSHTLQNGTYCPKR